MATSRTTAQPLNGIAATPSAAVGYVLVAANVIPLLGVLFLGWDLRGLLTLYWLENLVIGAWTIVRMAHTLDPLAILIVPFFLIHFGGFCAIHGLFLMMLTGADTGSGSAMGGSAWFGPLVFLQLLVNVVAGAARQAPELFYLPLGALVVSHGVSTVYYHFLRGEDRGRAVNEIMGDPYGRIVLMHITILAGAVPTMLFGSPLAMLVILVIGKTTLDLVLHRRAHRRRAQRALAAT
jgi:hypothetical protein